MKELGRGSFGKTILIEYETINELFVCKKYQPQFGINKEKYYNSRLDSIERKEEDLIGKEEILF